MGPLAAPGVGAPHRIDAGMYALREPNKQQKSFICRTANSTYVISAPIDNDGTRIVLRGNQTLSFNTRVRVIGAVSPGEPLRLSLPVNQQMFTSSAMTQVQAYEPLQAIYSPSSFVNNMSPFTLTCFTQNSTYVFGPPNADGERIVLAGGSSKIPAGSRVKIRGDILLNGRMELIHGEKAIETSPVISMIIDEFPDLQTGRGAGQEWQSTHSIPANYNNPLALFSHNGERYMVLSGLNQAGVRTILSTNIRELALVAGVIITKQVSMGTAANLTVNNRDGRIVVYQTSPVTALAIQPVSSPVLPQTRMDLGLTVFGHL
ncbi:hypothetical protein HZB07_01705 [Candidatus Saganbacteria bacterium]|nr:hypothetical protein [Candidatus Saganbacteria bacterium]